MGERNNRVALVTGGSRGIGKAVAVALAELGAAVALSYRERGDDARAVVAQIQSMGGRAEAFQCDVSLSAAVQQLCRSVEERLGPIDILVNNAGIAASHGEDIREEDFDRILSTNLKSAFLCTQAVVPGMRSRRWGRIVNISAMGARAGSSSVAYGASKAGLEGLTRSYALQLASEGVTCNCVAPGLIETEMTKELIDAGGAGSRVPMQRAGTPQEIAQAVIFVVNNSYVTGQKISVNGGAYFA